MALVYHRNLTYRDWVFTTLRYDSEVGQYQEADLAFQANKYSRWDEQQKSGYIRNFLLGFAPSKYIFADVEKCLECANERGIKDDITYYSAWLKKGVKYLNIDSNNRNNVHVAFRNGEVTLPHGKYKIDDAECIVDSDNDTYDTCPEIVRDAYNEALITISVYTNASRADLSELFRAVNDGKPLNAEEIRNSYITITANIIRELADEYGDYFVEQGKWFAPTAINRRGIDGFIADMAFIYAYGMNKGMSTSSLKNFYREGSDGEQSMPSFKKLFKSFMKEVMTKNAYAISNRNSVFDLFVIYIDLKNKKLAINDNKQFLKEYMKVVAELLQSKERYEADGWIDDKSFAKIVGGRQLTNNQIRHREIMKLFDVDALTTKKGKRTFNADDKMIIAVNDDWETPEGKEIEMDKLHDGDKYHGGHRIPYHKTKNSPIEDGAIQEKEDNWKLGGKDLVT
jgi:hypothetical protein